MQAEARAKEAALQALQADKEALAKKLASYEGEHSSLLARLQESQAQLEKARTAPPGETPPLPSSACAWF
jgi:chaperonin cofactor prefoldin